ncbi:MAG: histidine kinase [Bacteroidota bacterium]
MQLFALLYSGDLFRINHNTVTGIANTDATHPRFGRLVQRRNGEVWVQRTSSLYAITDRYQLKHLTEVPHMQSYDQSNDEDMWIAGINNICGLHGNRIAYFNQNVQFSTRITGICGYRDTLWVGGIDGLYRLDTVSNSLIKSKEKALNVRITDLKRTAGLLLIATRGFGVFIKKDDRLYHLSVKQGLVSNLCNSIYVASDSVVWISSHQGVSRILLSASPLSFRIKNYTTAHGLLSNEVNSITYTGGMVWMATNKGVSVLNTNETEQAPVPPRIHLNCVKVNRHEYPSHHPGSFLHEENSILFSFDGVAFKDHNHLLYTYRLEGWDSTWRYTAATEIQYGNLPPGDYTFKVYAKNELGTSLNPASYTFTIHRAWFQTGWFISLAIVFVLLLLLAALKVVQNVEKKKALVNTNLNKRIAQMELKALQAQMNPHFIFNSLNSIQKFIGRNDKESAYRYLSRFGSLIRTILNNRGSGFQSLREEVNLLDLYLQLELLRLEDKLSYRIIVADDIDQDNIFLPTMVIQPFVENAVWHGIMPLGKPGTITIHFERKAGLLRCVIQDNGVGRKKSEELKNSKRARHTSAGMAITRERLNFLSLTEDLESKIEITDLEGEAGSGTIVELLLPVKYEFEENR